MPESKIDRPSTPQSGTDYNSVQNPYNKRTYEETPWDSFVHMLGFRSAYDKAEAERIANYNLWESHHSEQQRQEMYNSAEEVKAREESAGLNPALSGNTIGGGSSDALSSAPATAVAPEADNVVGTIANIGQLAYNAIYSGLNLAMGIAQVKGVKISNDNNLIQQYIDILSAGAHTVQKTHRSVSDFESYPSSIELDASIKTALQEFLPKRLAKKVQLSRGLLQNSDYGKGFIAGIQNSSAGEIASAFGSQKLVSGTKHNRTLGTLEPVTDFVSKVADIQINYAEKIYTEMANLKYNRDKSQFEYEISSYDFMKAQKELMDDMFSVTREMIGSMRSRAEGKDGFLKWLNQGMLVGLSTLMSGVLPSISVGSSGSESWKSGNNGGSTSFGKNFGISF